MTLKKKKKKKKIQQLIPLNLKMAYSSSSEPVSETKLVVKRIFEKK